MKKVYSPWLRDSVGLIGGCGGGGGPRDGGPAFEIGNGGPIGPGL